MTRDVRPAPRVSLLPRLAGLVLAILAGSALLLAGCVRCHEFPPGTKLVRVGGPNGGFVVRPQEDGSPETRPSK